MWIAWGTMRVGRVEACDGSVIVTDFFHVCFLPIWPQLSWVQPVELGAFEDPDPRFDRIAALPRLHPRSVALGLARTFGLAGAIAAALVFLVRATSDQIVGNALLANGACTPIRLSEVWAEDLPTLLVGAIAVVLAGLTGAFLGLGRLDAVGRAQRRVYALVTGMPVDPAHLPPDDELRASVVETATSVMAQGGYRTPRQPEHDWPAIALDPTLADVGFVSRAFTLARAEQATATPPRIAELREAHAALWDRLQTLATTQRWTAPDDLAAARAEELRRQKAARQPRSSWLALLVAFAVLAILMLIQSQMR